MGRIATYPATLAIVCVASTACAGVSYREDIAERIDVISQVQLRADILALDAIGPRPVSDAAATRATVDYLTEELVRLGFEVHEERSEFRLSSSLFAVVRPATEPDASTTEIEVAPDLALVGRHAMRAKTDELNSKGWKVEGYRSRPDGDVRVCSVVNLIATRRGTHEPDRVLEIGAHYDTVPYSAGADDNSSGVAALLGVARVVATASMERTIRLCVFGGEEVGLRGSAEHVARLDPVARARIDGMINLDSVGLTTRGSGAQRQPADVPWYLSLPDEGDFVIVVGTWSSGWLGNLFEGAIDAYAPDLPYYSANRIGSRFRDAHRGDHANYWRAGIDAMAASDTGEFRGSHYHRPSDTPDTIDYAFLEGVTRATAAAALHWAGYLGEAESSGRH